MSKTELVLLPLLALVACVSCNIDTTQSLNPTLHAIKGASRESVLELVEQVLAQQDSSTTGDVSSSSLRDMLDRFENEIVVELKEKNSEALHSAWNATISNILLDQKLTRAQLIKTQSALYDSRSQRDAATRDLVSAKVALDDLIARRDYYHNRYLRLRQRLSLEDSKHLQPSLEVSTAISEHLTSLFNLLPRTTNPAAHHHSFLEISNEVDGSVLTVPSRILEFLEKPKDTQTSRFEYVLVLTDTLVSTPGASQSAAAIIDDKLNLGLHLDADVALAEIPESHFIQIPKATLPAPQRVIQGLSFESCADACLKSASCFAFEHSKLRNGSSSCAMQKRRIVNNPDLIVPGDGDVYSLRLGVSSFIPVAFPMPVDRTTIISTQILDLFEQCAQTCLSQETCYGVTFGSDGNCTTLDTAGGFELKRLGRRVGVRVTLPHAVSHYQDSINFLCDPNLIAKMFVGSDLSVSVPTVVEATSLDGDVPVATGLCSDHITKSRIAGTHAADTLAKIATLNDRITTTSIGSSIRFKITLSNEYDSWWMDREGVWLVSVINTEMGTPLSFVLESATPDMLITLSVSVGEADVESVVAKFRELVLSGRLALALSNSGISVGWVGLVGTPDISLKCSNTFEPYVGQLTCNSVTTRTIMGIDQPCGCAHYAAVNDMVYFTYDSQSSTCMVFKPSVPLESLDDWFGSQCTVSVAEDGIHFFSGKLMDPFLSRFEVISGQKLIGGSVQHRINEKDADCCARQCLERSWCRSFGWGADSRLCDLHNSSVTSPEASLVASSGMDHYELTNRNSRPLEPVDTEVYLRKLATVLREGLLQSITALHNVQADLDDEHDLGMSDWQAQIDNATSTVTQLNSTIISLNGTIQKLRTEVDDLVARDANITTNLEIQTKASENELSVADDNVLRWQNELETIRQLKDLVDSLVVIDTDAERERALTWLRSKQDIQNSGALFTPFHDSPSSVLTASGDYRNKVEADGNRITGAISCSADDKSIVYSLMAEANVTYSFRLYLKGYSLTDAMMLIRDAPSLAIKTDLVNFHPPNDLTVLDGIANPEDTQPYAKLVWECDKTGWYVLQVSATSAKSCGTFGLVIDSTAPPFWLVVDGKKQMGAIACNTTATPSTPTTAVFRFDGLAGVSYQITTFAKNDKDSVSGTVMFLRDVQKGNILSAGDDSTNTVSSSRALRNSRVRWICPHNGQYEIQITPTGKYQCGTFGVKIETLTACLLNPCPATTRCEDQSTPGDFLCISDSTAVSTSRTVSDYGVDVSMWLNMPFSVNWEPLHAATFTRSIATAVNANDPSTSAQSTVVLSSVFAESGGVVVTFFVSSTSTSGARAVDLALRTVVTNGALNDDLVAHGITTQGVWILSMALRDVHRSWQTTTFGAVLYVSGISDLALLSPSVIIPLRIAVSNAVPGVHTEDVIISSISSATTVSHLSLMLAQLEHETALNVTITVNTTDTAIEMARALTHADLSVLINTELADTGLSQRVNTARVDRVVMPESVVQQQCSWSDDCSGCDQKFVPAANDWLVLDAPCQWTPEKQKCLASGGAVMSPCRRSVSGVSTFSPQLLYVLRFADIGSNQTLYQEVIRAAMWWTHVTEPSRVEVTKGVTDGAGNWQVNVIIGAKSRQDAVEMMRLLDKALVSGDFLQFIRNKVTVGSVVVVESRLTSERETGISVVIPETAAAPTNQRCERIAVDTGGCDETFTLAAPYTQNGVNTIPTPDGTVNISKACSDQGVEFQMVRFPLGRRGSVIFVDSAYVDTSRVVPHLISALPDEATPHSAVALTHTPEQWAALLADKAWLIFPKLHGPLHGPIIDAAHKAVIRDFVLNGGRVIFTASPIRASSTMNFLFGFELSDVAPEAGGVVFLPGTVSIETTTEFQRLATTHCATSWLNQNSFAFLTPASLPPLAKPLAVTGASANIAVFDTKLTVDSGHVMFFGFDFFDAANTDTSCVLRHAMAYQFQ